MADANRPVTLAAIAGAHGVRGEVRLKLFGEGAQGLRAFSVFDAGGRKLTLKSVRPANQGAVAAFAEITDRSAAETPALKSFADAHQTSADVVAIAAALANPFVDVVLSGAVTVDQLESNLRAIDLARIAGDWPKIAQNADEYWAQRKRRAWG